MEEEIMQQALFEQAEDTPREENSEQVKQSDAQMEALGRYVRMKRKSLSLTQRKLAEISGVSRSEISCVERGILSTTGKRIIRSLADALDVDAVHLLSLAGFQADPGDEARRIMKAFDKMSEDERKRAFELMTLVFPDAFKEPEEA